MAVPSRVAQLRWWSGAVCLGLAVAPAARIDAGWLAHGGLAPLAVAAVVAAFVGVPLATAEWRVGPLDRAGTARWRPWTIAAEALATLWAVLVVAASLAPIVREGGVLGGALAAAFWVLVGLLVTRLQGALAAAFAGGALVLAAITTGLAAAEAPPWTLLDPRWETWAAWLPGAIVLGLLLPVAGLGLWGLRAPVPGPRRAPWLTAGGALLLVLLGAVRAGAAHELGLTGESAADLVPLLAVTAAAAAVSSGAAPSSFPRVRVLGGVLATWWFAFPAHGTLPLWWASLLPLGIAAVAAAVALVTSGTARMAAVAGVVLAVGATIAGWPGLPPGAGTAAATAAVLVVAVWVAGTAALLDRSMEAPS